MLIGSPRTRTHALTHARTHTPTHANIFLSAFPHSLRHFGDCAPSIQLQSCCTLANITVPAPEDAWLILSVICTWRNVIYKITLFSHCESHNDKQIRSPALFQSSDSSEIYTSTSKLTLFCHLRVFCPCFRPKFRGRASTASYLTPSADRYNIHGDMVGESP